MSRRKIGEKEQEKLEKLEKEKGKMEKEKGKKDKQKINEKKNNKNNKNNKKDGIITTTTTLPQNPYKLDDDLDNFDLNDLDLNDELDYDVDYDLYNFDSENEEKSEEIENFVKSIKKAKSEEDKIYNIILLGENYEDNVILGVLKLLKSSKLLDDKKLANLLYGIIGAPRSETPKTIKYLLKSGVDFEDVIDIVFDNILDYNNLSEELSGMFKWIKEIGLTSLLIAFASDSRIIDNEDVFNELISNL